MHLRLFVSCIGLAGSSAVAHAAVTQQNRAGPASAYAAEHAASAQSTGTPSTIALDLRDVTLQQAIDAIAAQGELRISYTKGDVSSAKRITLQRSAISPSDALAYVLRGTGLRVVTATNGQLMVMRREPGSDEAQDSTGSVTGQIVESATRTPMSGISVQLVGTKFGAISKSDGSFTIPGVPNGTYTLRATRIGYGAREIRVIVTGGKTARVSFEVTPIPMKLNDVITTTAGTQKRLELGNSVATINADSVVRNSPIRNLSDLLSYRAPGVSMNPTSGVSGAGTRVRIRGLARVSGSNDPIVIVDGVRLDADYSSGNTSQNQTSVFTTSAPSRLDDIDPNTIETIDILKGPSAATLYGTDAANGVIVITTKRGKAGPTRWSLTGERGTMRVHSKYDDNYLGWGNNAAEGPNGSCTLADVASGLCTGIDSITHWNPLNHDETSPLGTGRHSQYSAQVSGGSDRMQYFFSGDLVDELGLLRMPDADVKRLLARRHGDAIPDWQMHPNTLQKQSGTSRVSALFGGTGDMALTTSFIHQGQRNAADESVAARALQSAGYRDANDGWSVNNSPAELFAPRITSDILRGYAALNSNLHPYSWLSGRGTIGVDYTNRDDESLTRPGDIPNNTGMRAKTLINTALYSVDLGSTATLPITSFLKSRTTIGAQYNRTATSLMYGSGTGLSLGQENFNSVTSIALSESFSEIITAGWYLEETGIINDRLFLTAAFRQDAGSAFGKDVKAPIYPKLSLSWIASQEPFFPRAAWLSNLRFRAAYGQAGVQPGTSDAIRTFTPASGIVDGVVTPVAYLNGIGNAELLPERAREFEGGFDLSVLDDRFTVEGTYYRKESQDALVSHTLPPSAGVQSRRENIGKVRNSGMEWSLTARPLLTRLVTWDLSLGISRNQNKLVTLGAHAPPLGNNQERYVPGYPLSGRWEYPILGYHDANGNGILERSELQMGDSMIFVGQTIPSRQSTLSSTVGLLDSRLRITTVFDFQGGLGQVAQAEWTRCLGNKCRAAVDPNSSLASQAAALAAQSPYLSLYGFIRPVSWTRFAELSIAYDVPQSVVRRIHANSATVSLLGRNLGLWSGYVGADPGVNTAPIREVTRDDGAIPPSRDWYFRISLGL